MFLDHFPHQLTQVLSGGLHFELIVSSFLTVGVGVASAIDVGQAVDLAFDVHSFFEALFGGVGLVEFLSGLNFIAVETDKEIAGGALFAVRAAALLPQGTVTAEFGRETKISAALTLRQVTASGGQVVRTGHG